MPILNAERPATPALAADGSQESAWRRDNYTNSKSRQECNFDLDDAEADADDLLVLWRECRRLDHHVKLARLKAEYVGLDAEEQAALARAVAEFNLLTVI